MGLFGKSGSKHNNRVQVGKITHDDEKRLKMRSENIHDPILNAVNEAQPFEEAAYHERNPSSLSGEGRINDVFGNPITNPDVSNPARSRDERPLDTIRAFEYSITGDAVFKQQLETPQLGWRVRDDFPLFTSNPYGQGAAAQPEQYDEYGRPTYNGQNSSNAMGAEQGVYTPPVKKETKKKKRGFFGRGKK
ncbi:DEKNAAC100687 [Brettanomyces naardenensis]|uniref:DEKNAAC100687 n=1 Tax=Brettanomyces naardenensis TaxID=13370 RepID=A0A448YEX0_BRENA|nr:DEKNAAC100687 [Brettanomyces naardenensis]